MDYVAAVEGKLGKEEAERRIGEKAEGFHGMLTREAAAKIIASEMGLIEREVAGIGGVKEGMASVDLRVRVEGIGELRSFPSGAMLRTLTVSDSSGEGEVNFWGEDAKKAGGMHLLDTLEVKKGYVKMGRVNVGYKSTYSVAAREEVLSVSDVAPEEGGRFNVMGRVTGIAGMGERGKTFMFTVGEGEREIPVSLINSPSKGKHLRVGDSVLLEGAQHNGAEILLEGRARMLLKKNRKDIYRGELKGIEADGEGGKILMEDGREFALGREGLIKFLNLKEISGDMDVGMLVQMKSPELVGRRVFVKFRDEESGEVEFAQAR